MILKAPRRRIWTRELSWPSGWRWYHAVPILIYLEIAFYLLAVPNSYGTVHDWSHFLSTLFSNRLFFLKNGAFHLPYYSPAFAGGSPRYADPVDMTFSIVQWTFNLAPTPREGLVLGFLICLMLSYAGAYRFLRQCQLSAWVATTGAFLFSLNGHIINRWVVGHASWQTYWAIPWVLSQLQSLTQPSSLRRKVSSSLWVGILLSLMIYGAGYYVLVYTLFLELSWLVAERLVRSRRLAEGGRGLLPTAIAGSLVLSALLCTSKLVAMHDYVRQFPTQTQPEFTGLRVIAVLIRGLVDPRIHLSSRFAYYTWGWWEYGAYVGLSTFLCALGGIFYLLWREPTDEAVTDRPMKLLAVWVGISTAVSFYLSLGINGGWFYLRMLPLFDSLHLGPRFAGMLPLPWIALGMSFVDHVRNSWRKPWLAGAICILCGFDVLFYHASNDDRIFADRWIVRNPTSSLSSFMIRGWTERGPDPSMIADGYGDLLTYNPLFGKNAENIVRNLDWHLPPWHQFKDGTYNLHDPVALIYPRDIGEMPWARLPNTVPLEQVRRFLAFEDPHFFIPRRQRAANAVSAATVLTAAGALLILSFG
jgi:hypothetical protein